MSDVAQLVPRQGAVVLELGCGPHKRYPDAIGIDALEYPGVDIVGDVFEVLSRFEEASVDSVHSYHFVEHIEDLDSLLLSLARIVRPGGLVEFVAPHFANPYFYSDPTHKRFFGLYTMDYFATSSPHRRKVPTYQRQLHFRVEETRLGFKSTVPFYFRHGLKRLGGFIFDSCNYMRELHEEMFSSWFSAYEVKYRLRRI